MTAILLINILPIASYSPSYSSSCMVLTFLFLALYSISYLTPMSCPPSASSTSYLSRHTRHRTRHQRSDHYPSHCHATRRVLSAIVLAARVLTAILLIDILPVASHSPSYSSAHMVLAFVFVALYSITYLTPTSCPPSTSSTSYPLRLSHHRTRRQRPDRYPPHQHPTRRVLPTIVHAVSVLTAILLLDILPVASYSPSYSYARMVLAFVFVPLYSILYLTPTSFPPSTSLTSYSSRLTRYRTRLLRLDRHPLVVHPTRRILLAIVLVCRYGTRLRLSRVVLHIVLDADVLPAIRLVDILPVASYIPSYSQPVS
jgi:hypothetical protein